MNKKLIRKMLTASGGPIYEKDWSDKVEPYAAGIGLAGDAIGLGTAATGIGIPVGAAIAGFANVPNLIIDGYLTARDTWRSFNDGGNSLGSAAWNGGEFLLDTVGLKALQYINKAAKAGVASEKYLTSTEKALDSKPWKRVGTGHGRVRARQSADHKRKYNSGRNKALEESNIELAKRGVRPALGLYYQQKLTDEMAKRGYGVAVNDAIKSANRTLRQNLAAVNTISGGTNVYHLLSKHKSGGQVRKMQTAAGGPINWLRKRIYTNIEPFGYNDVGSRLINAIVFNKNEHDNYKGNYSDMERAPALYLTTDDLWREYLHVSEDEGRYSNGKYKIKNNGNGTFSLPFKSMEDIMLTVNSNNPLLWGLRGKAVNSVVGEYDIYRGYDKKGDYLKYIDHWRINPYDVKKDKEYGLDNNSLLKRYFKGKDDASFGLGTPVEIQGKYYLDDIYNIKGKDRGGHYLPEVIVTGKKKQGGKMNVLKFLKNGSGIHIKEKNKGKFTSYCGGKVTDECILKGKNSSNPAIRKRATFAANARKWKHKEGGSIEKLEKGSWIKNSLSFLNESGLGKTLVEGGLSFLLSSSQNKSIAGATDVAKAELDKEKLEAEQLALLMATKKALEMLLMDPNNPNAFGGSIVLNYIRLQLYNEYLNSINLDIANRKALLDMLSLQMLNENTSGAISGIIQSGLGVVGNLLGGKKDTPSINSTGSSTKSVVLPKLTSNKWTPSTSLNNPVLGNNTLGYMPNYTSLLNVKK